MHTKYKGHKTRAEPRGWGGVGLHVEADVDGPAVQRLRGTPVIHHYFCFGGVYIHGSEFL